MAEPRSRLPAVGTSRRGLDADMVVSFRSSESEEYNISDCGTLFEATEAFIQDISRDGMLLAYSIRRVGFALGGRWSKVTGTDCGR